MSEKVKEFFEHYKKDMGRLQKLAPDVITGFGGMFNSVMKDDALSLKHKELIALGIGVALRCEPCINLHVKKCMDAGATREEVFEAAGVAVMMQGGPGFVYLPVVLDAIEVAYEKGPVAG